MIDTGQSLIAMPVESHQEPTQSTAVDLQANELPGDFFQEVYAQLHALAKAQMAKERANHTLQPTALVNEAYVRLFGNGEVSWESRRQFFGTASKVMRSLLVDHARGRNAKKRGGNLVKVPLTEHASTSSDLIDLIDVLDLHESLERLASIDSSMSDAVEMRYFGGLSIKETAAALGVPLRTTERRLRTAGMWLRDDLAT